MLDLAALRREIDGIDDEMLALYRRRMEIVTNVARYKAEHHLAIFHPDREEQIFRRMEQAAGPACAEGAKTLFTTLMDVSKCYQHREIARQGKKNDLLYTLEEAAAAGRRVPMAAAVACAGVPGAYAHEAAQKLFAMPEMHFYPGFEAVFEAVAEGRQEYGVLPIDNSSAGTVREVYDYLTQYKLTICKTCKLPIRHCLLALKGAREEALTDIYSHEQALGQCAGYLRGRPGLKAHIYSNTAAAAQYVAALGSPTAAAIASQESARLYGLKTLREDLQDAHLNQTRFIAVSRELIIEPGADKISLCLSLPHVTGSLHRLLTRFAMQSLNLVKLESRPLPETDFEFLFYFDLEGSVRDPNVRTLLGALSEELSQFEFLGNYR